jgi:4-diphosphocytidyl-2-C-methyl-D-erythritol kinase
MLTVRAPAKVNLALEVLGKRSDGYHEVRSVIQAVSLCDELSFTPAPELTLVCNEPGLENPENLVIRAAMALRRFRDTKPGAAIRLEKRIPWGMGLGGGSSDAAATLACLNRIWGLGLSGAQLYAAGAELGSDVPFFLHGGTCEVSGRGEEVRQLPDMSKNWFVIVKPDGPTLPNKTKRMYMALKKEDFTDGRFTTGIGRTIASGKPIDASMLYNAFERAAHDLFPQLQAARRNLEDMSGSFRLCGAGPAIFTLVDNQADAEAVHKRLKSAGIQSLVAESLTRAECSDFLAELQWPA